MAALLAVGRGRPGFRVAVREAEAGRARSAGLGKQVAFPPVVWSLGELQAGKGRFEAAFGGFLSDGPAQLRGMSIDEPRNLVAVDVAPELSRAGLRVLAEAMASGSGRPRAGECPARALGRHGGLTRDPPPARQR